MPGSHSELIHSATRGLLSGSSASIVLRVSSVHPVSVHRGMTREARQDGGEHGSECDKKVARNTPSVPVCASALRSFLADA